MEFRYESAEHEVEQFETKFGPILKARELLEPQGRWEALHEDLVAHARRYAVAGGPSVSFGEYLMTVGTKEQS